MKFIASGIVRLCTKQTPKHLVRVMKLTTFLLLAVALQVSAPGYVHRITLSGKDIPLGKVFSAIENQTGYDFIYDHGILQGARTETLDWRDMALEDVLKASLKDQPLDFRIVGKCIYLKKNASGALGGQVTGWSLESRQAKELIWWLGILVNVLIKMVIEELSRTAAKRKKYHKVIRYLILCRRVFNTISGILRLMAG